MKKSEMSELAQIKVDLRNANKMLNQQRITNKSLKEKNKVLTKENKELLDIIAFQKEELERKQHTIDEYSRMIFRPKNKTNLNDKNTSNNDTKILDNENKPERSKESYKRKIPEESKITYTRETSISVCPVCGNPLKNIKKIERYVEDISFRDIQPTITKYIIHSGYCSHCKKQKSLADIPKGVVMLGENIRMFVNYSCTVMKLSYETLKSLLKTLYNFEISDGEIRNILETEAKILTPEYNQIKDGIQKQFGVHFDESGWNVQSEESNTYAWVMTGIENNDVIFDLGISRGGGEVDILGGIDENKMHVGITDGYGSYTNKFGLHQLCWAHPYRKLRDLKDSKHLDEEKKARCKIIYEKFGELYSKVMEEIKLEKIRIENGKESPDEYRVKLKEKLLKEFLSITKIYKNDPKKLVTYKESLVKYCDKYFVCILHPGIPADNNKAERSLRHLVLKRKMCHGSKTTQSAAFMSINYSVLLSIFWKHPTNFFGDYKYVRDLYFKDLSFENKEKELKF